MSNKKSIAKVCSMSLIAAGCALAATVNAQPMEVVTVEAAREIIIGKTAIGAPIKEITIRSRVSYADLDLTTEAGAAELAKRIRDTSEETCKEIKVDRPAEGSTHEKCVREAIDGGMAQANEAIAAKRAAKK